MGSTKESESKNQSLQKPGNLSLSSRIHISRWLKWHSCVIQHSYDVHSAKSKWDFSLKTKKGRTDSWKALLWPPYAPMLTIYMHLWAHAHTHTEAHMPVCTHMCTCTHTEQILQKRTELCKNTCFYTHSKYSKYCHWLVSVLPKTCYHFTIPS